MCKDDCVYKYTCKYNFLTSFLLFVCLHGLRADHFAFYNQQGGSSLEEANSPSPSNNWLPVCVEVRPQVFSPFHVNTSPIDITFALALFRKPFLEGGVPQQDFWTLVQSLCRRQEMQTHILHCLAVRGSERLTGAIYNFHPGGGHLDLLKKSKLCSILRCQHMLM